MRIRSEPKKFCAIHRDLKADDFYINRSRNLEYYKCKICAKISRNKYYHSKEKIGFLKMREKIGIEKIPQSKEKIGFNFFMEVLNKTRSHTFTRLL